MEEENSGQGKVEAQKHINPKWREGTDYPGQDEARDEMMKKSEEAAKTRLEDLKSRVVATPTGGLADRLRAARAGTGK
jgi:hypothetical protein